MPIAAVEIAQIDKRVGEVVPVLSRVHERLTAARQSRSNGNIGTVLIGTGVGGGISAEISKLELQEANLKNTIRDLLARKAGLERAEAIKELERADFAHREAEMRVRELTGIASRKRDELLADIPRQLNSCAIEINIAVERRREARMAHTRARGNDARVEDLMRLTDEQRVLAEQITAAEKQRELLNHDLTVSQAVEDRRDEETNRTRLGEMDLRLQRLRERKLEVDGLIATHELEVTRAELGVAEVALRAAEAQRVAKREELEASIRMQLVPFEHDVAAAIYERRRAGAELTLARNAVERVAHALAA